MTRSSLNCEDFDALFSDYLEGTLDAELCNLVEHHLGECVRCAGLVRDIDKLQEAAAALPDLIPSRDLWAGIEARIAAPVLPLVARPAPPRRVSPAWLGVAAAALIVSTAGITYTLTTRSIGQPPARAVASTNPPSIAVPANEPATAAGPQAQIAAATTNPSVPGTGNSVAREPRAQSSVTGPASNARLVSQNDYSEVVYAREISMLQNILRDRRTQLDSGTVAIIERNLSIIDAAIAQSKAALAKDPASRLLGEQLTHALDKKVELLRTAAMLPLST